MRDLDERLLDWAVSISLAMALVMLMIILALGTAVLAIWGWQILKAAM